MPKFHTTPLEQRETVDLCAPWWSQEKDEDGRPRERVTVVAYMTEGDQQFIQKQVMSGIKAGTSRAAMQAALADMSQYAQMKTYQLLRVVREWTDDTGAPQQITKQMIEALDARDSAWLSERFEELYEAAVPVLAKDHAEAERNKLRLGEKATVEDIDPQLVAAGNFRRRR
jgi:hypothetical protein